MGLPIGEDHLLTPSFVEDHMVIVQDAFDLGFRLIKLYNTYEQMCIRDRPKRIPARGRKMIIPKLT